MNVYDRDRIKVRLTKEHTHDGVTYAPGAVLELPHRLGMWVATGLGRGEVVGREVELAARKAPSASASRGPCCGRARRR
jgi:hypothetical protein